ncbi:MAG: hypothetical protein M1818_007428 [Claussenomyces sp. TS43310]|nr:MAG: hypothetical protein M1818_007428 [Claussenomyces sp. TS43310]
MVNIKPFVLEQLMDKYEVVPNVLNIAETCAAPVSIDDLVALSEDRDAHAPALTSTKLTYGPIPGSAALRSRLSALYSARVMSILPDENVLITPGAIAANFLAMYTLVGPGDHVICVYPTYQQLYSVPESLGAEVSLWRLKRENRFVPDLDDLKSLLKDNTKLIVINNPNNPTGSTTRRSILTGLVEIAKERNIIILSDEVYRPLFTGISPVDNEYPPSIINLGYDRTIATGSMSKAYALAGIRVGWIASHNSSLMEEFAKARAYTNISVSQIDDQIATFALSPSVFHPLLSRNIKLAKTNLAMVEAFVREWNKYLDWVKPTAGTTAFIEVRKGNELVDDEKFCETLLEKTKVMLMPGSKCFGDGVDFKGFIRIGYVCETAVLKAALEKWGDYMRQDFAE